MEKRKNKIIIFLLILSLLIFLSIFYINSKIILEKREIVARLIVRDRSGFDLNSTALTFGMIKPGSSASRKIAISNNYSFPVKFEFSANGNIKDFLVFEKIIYLEPGEDKEITFSTIDPDGQEQGTYEGKVIIKIKRAL